MGISRGCLPTPVVSDGLECFYVWVRLAGSNVIFTWNYPFCQVAVMGRYSE